MGYFHAIFIDKKFNYDRIKQIRKLTVKTKKPQEFG